MKRAIGSSIPNARRASIGRGAPPGAFTHARLARHDLDLAPLSTLGEYAWSPAFETALRADGAENPLQRLRLGGHPCFVQSGGYVDDETFVTAELPASALGLAPMYFYLFGEGDSFSQLMQMT